VPYLVSLIRRWEPFLPFWLHPILHPGFQTRKVRAHNWYVRMAFSRSPVRMRVIRGGDVKLISLASSPNSKAFVRFSSARWGCPRFRYITPKRT
jgi:hypothetical protein